MSSLLARDCSDRSAPSAPAPPADEHNAGSWFDQGNYARVARHGDPDDWRTFAALGLIGKPREALEGLRAFDQVQARFYAGVAHWIEGDKAQALACLRGNPLPHARRLEALLRKSCIEVLAQLPWLRGGCADLWSGMREVPGFRMRAISFQPDDLPNEPHADVRRFIDPAAPPDFYLCNMVEWHAIPPNLGELPCPIFGQTGDYDLHIQTVLPWLNLFDEIVVTDPSEWADVRGLTPVPVSTFPKTFGVPGDLPPLPSQPRPLDVYLSGTILHPYHPDKTRLLHQVLSLDDLRSHLVNGFHVSWKHYQFLAQAKVCVSYVRHAGAMPTRALEALAMGCATLIQNESVLNLYVGDADGVVPYQDMAQDLPAAIRRVVDRWPQFESQARRGGLKLRDEFALPKVAGQFLRYLTFLAARPRRPRIPVPANALCQKRVVLEKGWLPSRDLENSPLLQRLARANRERFHLQASHHPESPRPLLDAVREHVLANYHQAIGMPHILLPWAEQVRASYREGLTRWPRSLVIRFNFVRTMLHFGTPDAVTEALELLEQTLGQPASFWILDVQEDVFPWDFFPLGFNYRRYFDGITEHLQRGGDVGPRLIRLIQASLHGYRGAWIWRHGQPAAALHDFQQAHWLDPEFSPYQFLLVQALLTRAWPEDLQTAWPLLRGLLRESMLQADTLDLLDKAAASIGPLPDDLVQSANAARTACARIEFQERPAFPNLQPDIRRANDRHGDLVARLGEADEANARLRQRIAVMESSKFWLARTAWWRCKRWLGLGRGTLPE